MTALQELRTVMTNSAGDEIRIYDEYRPNGRGGRTFIGYLVDDGKDRVQVSDWLAALKQASANGTAWTKKDNTTDEYDESAQAEREAFAQGARDDAAAWEGQS